MEETVQIAAAVLFGVVGMCCIVTLTYKYIDAVRDDYHKRCDEKLDRFTAELMEEGTRKIAEYREKYAAEADRWRQKYEAEHARAEALQAERDAWVLNWRLVGSEGEAQKGRLVAVWIDGKGPFIVALAVTDKDVLPGHEVVLEAEGAHVKGAVTHVDYRIGSM